TLFLVPPFSSSQILPSAPGQDTRCPRLAEVFSPEVWFGLTFPLRCLCFPFSRSAVFWRPWVKARGEKEEGTLHYAAETIPNGPGMIQASGKLFQYTHPVRLFWPKSKCYDYLYQEAEALLKIFPIQATISFYEDSDSEDEIEQLTCEN
ncbi:protein ripply2, partial [Marmota monax]|uniref:protein ripply2 n=1 Tax=Marmota monax TaxID=9995 RepID=UPI0026F20142